ncbi:hypothetical protein NDU88_005105 [Pleurodeles waltl]|uniref:Uncharacterized protein n=1 Tax=Pleurodeles waltl TaxID=8319 RepID=A0AAV7NVM9_PLEWA|nr:hypothetical protein NDU88_005105 [Pleurodeles waltl]
MSGRASLASPLQYVQFLAEEANLRLSPYLHGEKRSPLPSLPPGPSAQSENRGRDLARHVRPKSGRVIPAAVSFIVNRMAPSVPRLSGLQRPPGETWKVPNNQERRSPAVFTQSPPQPKKLEQGPALSAVDPGIAANPEKPYLLVSNCFPETQESLAFTSQPWGVVKSVQLSPQPRRARLPPCSLRGGEECPAIAAAQEKRPAAVEGAKTPSMQEAPPQSRIERRRAAQQTHDTKRTIVGRERAGSPH